MEPLRILVVDDFPAWREQVCAILKKRSEIEVVGEAANGLEAVQKAQELQPDLILLDISLPFLDGFEAARQIGQIASNSRIIFISQHVALDFVEAAFGVGARGYLLKADVGAQLLIAVQAVIEGGYFVSRSIAHDVLDDDVTTRASYKLASADEPGKDIIRPGKQKGCHSHEVGFYSDDIALVDSFHRFIAEELARGGSVIFVGTRSHRESLLSRLRAERLDIVTAIEQGRYVQLDAADSLATFMVGNMPDSNLFIHAVGNLIESAAKAATPGHRCVSACGECAPILLSQGNVEGAIRLEQLWDSFAKAHEVNILCGYPLVRFRPPGQTHVFQKIRAAHSGTHFR